MENIPKAFLSLSGFFDLSSSLHLYTVDSVKRLVPVAQWCGIPPYDHLPADTYEPRQRLVDKRLTHSAESSLFLDSKL